MKTLEKINEILAYANMGTDEPPRYNPLFGKNFIYTATVKDFIEAADAGWLLDAILSYRRTDVFQIWELKVKPDKTAVLTMKHDTNEKEQVRQEFDYTDFPLESIKFYSFNRSGTDDKDEIVCLMLAQEY